MASDIKNKLSDDMKTAMRAKDKERLGVIRLIMAALKQKEVDERIELDDAQVLAVLDKMAKQRRDSIAQYKAAARQDLADKEQFEIDIIQAYLPKALAETEIAELIKAAIASSGAQDMKDMGKVMAILKPQVQGRADVGLVSQKVKSALAN